MNIYNWLTFGVKMAATANLSTHKKLYISVNFTFNELNFYVVGAESNITYCVQLRNICFKTLPLIIGVNCVHLSKISSITGFEKHIQEVITECTSTAD